MKRRSLLIPIGPSIAYVPLTQGQYARIDRGMAEIVGAHNWHAQWAPNTKSFYAVRHERSGPNRFLGMHAFLIGVSPTDHRNHDTLNNLPHNLRGCSVGLNSANKRQQSNRSGFKGVHKDGNNYRATLRYKGKLISRGSYKDPVTAAKAYDAGALEYFGDFAHLNFPDQPKERECL